MFYIIAQFSVVQTGPQVFSTPTHLTLLPLAVVLILAVLKKKKRHTLLDCRKSYQNILFIVWNWLRWYFSYLHAFIIINCYAVNCIICQQMILFFVFYCQQETPRTKLGVGGNFTTLCCQVRKKQSSIFYWLISTKNNTFTLLKFKKNFWKDANHAQGLRRRLYMSWQCKCPPKVAWFTNGMHFFSPNITQP